MVTGVWGGNVIQFGQGQFGGPPVIIAPPTPIPASLVGRCRCPFLATVEYPITYETFHLPIRIRGDAIPGENMPGDFMPDEHPTLAFIVETWGMGLE